MQSTRSKNKLWLIEKCPSAFSYQLDEYGSKPPTVEIVYLRYRYLLEQQQKGTKFVRDCSFIVADERKAWWSRTGIETITSEGIVKII